MPTSQAVTRSRSTHTCSVSCIVGAWAPSAARKATPLHPHGPPLALSGAFLGNRSFQRFTIAPFLSLASAWLVLQKVRIISKILASAERRRHTVLPALMVEVSLSYLAKLHEQVRGQKRWTFRGSRTPDPVRPAGVFRGADLILLAQRMACFSRGRTPLNFVFKDF